MFLSRIYVLKIHNLRKVETNQQKELLWITFMLFITTKNTKNISGIKFSFGYFFSAVRIYCKHEVSKSKWRRYIVKT